MDRTGVQRQTGYNDIASWDPPGRKAETESASPSLTTTAGLLALQRAAGNRAVTAALALQRERHRPAGPRPVTRRPPAGGRHAHVQRKLEFAQHYAAAPRAATAAVNADYEGYAAYQQQFEKKLGLGLFANAKAHEGADAMLSLMGNAMTAAGFTDQAKQQAFAAKIRKGDTTVDLGGVLAKDVDAALKSGNLREKMGMVYQARGDISAAIDSLTKQGSDLIGDEMSSPGMQSELSDVAAKKQHVSYAVLKRRQSVSDFKRTGAKTMKGVVRPDELEAEGIGFSEREKRAAQSVGAKKFYAGKEFYVVDPGARKQEQDKLRAVVAGLSGSTDMYFHIAKHLKMGDADRKKFRLAALGQMLVNQDHSYHEIMHVAKTQGELADYPDELPVGYTTLAPLTTDEILGLTGLADFPGDAQVREVGALATSADVKALAAAGAKSKSYPAVLQLIDTYHAAPSPEGLQAIVTAIDSFLSKKKPGRTARSKTKKKYEDRRAALEKVRRQCTQLQAQWQSLSKVPGTELAAFAQKSMQGGGAADIARMTRLIAQQEPTQGTDWHAKNFRATATDESVDTSAIHVSVDKQKHIMQEKDDARLARMMGDKTKTPKAVDINANLKTDLEGFLEGNKLIIDVVKGDLQPKKLTIKEKMNMKAVKQQQDIQSVIDTPGWHQDTEDFTTNIDMTAFAAVVPKPDPTDAVGILLKRMENHPTPKELQAINAYAQPGFYVIMNDVLNNTADKAFMASPKGKQWWAGVPAEVKQLTALAVSALRRLQPYTGGAVFRGQGGGVGRVLADTLKLPKAQREAVWKKRVGSTMHYSQFVSTSKRPYQSYTIKPDTWLALHINNPKTGIDISAFSNTLEEREVLFPPNTTFRVTKVEDKFKTAAEPNNRYSDAVLMDSKEPGRVKVTLEEV
jgi:hypothetical protein